MVQVKINLGIKDKLINSFGVNSKLQKFIDMSVARHSDSYAPEDTGALIKSVYINTDFGSGQLIYTVYGKHDGRNTWNDDISDFQDSPMRGSKWVERWLNGGGRETLLLEIEKFIEGVAR